MTTSSNHAPTIKLGDLAWHITRELDPRPVVAISEDHTMIKLGVGSTYTDWVPANNYHYTEAP